MNHVIQRTANCVSQMWRLQHSGMVTTMLTSWVLNHHYPWEIKLKWRCWTGHKIKYGCIQELMGWYFNINILIWMGIKFIWDFFPVLVVCKYHNDETRNEGTTSVIRIFPLLVYVTLSCLMKQFKMWSTNMSEIIVVFFVVVL